ncbi:hypothetical protein EMIT0P218_280014 [Pseudomonas sp. IT-P218]
MSVRRRVSVVGNVIRGVADAANSRLWPRSTAELACQRWRHNGHHRIASKPAPTDMCHATNSIYLRETCRSWLASDGGLTSNPSLAAVPNLLWEPACRRWRPKDQRIIEGRNTHQGGSI